MSSNPHFWMTAMTTVGWSAVSVSADLSFSITQNINTTSVINLNIVAQKCNCRCKSCTSTSGMNITVTNQHDHRNSTLIKLDLKMWKTLPLTELNTQPFMAIFGAMIMLMDKSHEHAASHTQVKLIRQKWANYNRFVQFREFGESNLT